MKPVPIQCSAEVRVGLWTLESIESDSAKMASTSEGSGVESAVAGVVASGGSLTTRGNVTVTPINMTNASSSSCQFSYSANGVRISVPSEELRTHSNLPIDDEDSNDAEVSKIDFLQYQVNMRNKKKRPSSSVQPCEATPEGGERERPMSWEGELSDTEMVDALTGDGEDDSSHLKVESESESRDLSVKEEPVMADTFHAHDDRDALDIKYAGVPQHSLHFHQRSLSMNRICVVTEGGPARRASPDRGRPPSAAPPPVPTTAPDGYQIKLEQHVLQQQQQIQQQQTVVPELKCEPGALVEKLLGSLHGTPSGSPLLPRQPRVLSNASNDSAIHSMYTHSVYSSPSASPGASRHGASLSRNNSDASHSSCYSYSSEFSPTHSPVQGRHGVLYREAGGLYPGSGSSADPSDTPSEPDHLHQGISRQQLINSPCPICGDKISGFHYGIFSCESCKGFFKRTVQNRKNYVCLRGANCPVTVATRKKCPACRFDKCLHCGMKLEAIREDRTRGGRSTYQCSYTLSGAASTGSLLAPALPAAALRHATSLTSVNGASTPHGAYSASRDNSGRASHDQPHDRLTVPSLLQEIMDVEHLWQYNESELSRLKSGQASASAPSNPLLAGGPDFLANLCNIADHRLYKIVKWCKSLPLFKNISIDDQICLLINSWCELLVLSCCYRGVGTPGEVRVGSGRGITLHQSDKLGLSPCIERMLHFTDHLRRLRVDRYEYVALKVIVLLTSDALELKEPEKVRASQERALAALQAYTASHYPDTPAKFGELLLRIPELQRTCQVGKEMLNPSNKSKDGEGSSFNLLMELLRGDH